MVKEVKWVHGVKLANLVDQMENASLFCLFENKTKMIKIDTLL